MCVAVCVAVCVAMCVVGEPYTIQNTYNTKYILYIITLELPVEDFCCNTLKRSATHSTACCTMENTVTHCNTLQHTATHYNTLQRTAKYRNTLQHTATHCNTLQHTATRMLFRSSPHINDMLFMSNPYINEMSFISFMSCGVELMTNTILQHTATHCNTLQHTATAMTCHLYHSCHVELN